MITCKLLCSDVGVNTVMLVNLASGAVPLTEIFHPGETYTISVHAREDSERAQASQGTDRTQTGSGV
jgi:hypothetical protein